MKRKISYALVLILTLFIASNSVAAQTIKGENNSKNNIKVSYNAKTKELYAYGFNKYGGLGTGNYNNVSQADKVKLNEKIGNKKIVDYIINLHNTYLLTEDGKVYVSGLRTGNQASKTNVFSQLKLYKGNSYPIKSFINIQDTIGMDIYSKELVNLCKLDETGCFTLTTLESKNSRVHYFYNDAGKVFSEILGLSKKDIAYIFMNIDDPSLSFSESKYFSELATISYNTRYPVMSKFNNKSLTVTTVNSKNQVNTTFSVNKKLSVIKKYTYKNNKIHTYAYYSNSKRVLQNYKKGILSSKRTTFYKNGKSISKRRIKLDYIDKYSHGKVVKRTTKKRINNRLKLYSITQYTRNKKGELKSNKFGKAFKNIKYYKNGKIYKKQKFVYNSKGAIIKKR